MYEDRDLRGLYKHLNKSVGLNGRQSGGQQYIKDEKCVLLRDKADILQRRARFFSTLLNTKSPKLNPAIIEEVQQRPAAPTTGDSAPLGSAPTLEETRQAIRGMHNWKAPGPDSLVAELLKTDEPAEPIVFERFRAILVEVWTGGEVPQQCSTRSRTDPTVITTGGSHFSRTQAKCF